MKLNLKYYFNVFLRRSPYFLIVASLFTSVGVTIAMLLPAEYEAKATLLVESPQIPTTLASSTVTTQAPEQLQIIQQRMFTRENLLDIANQLQVFDRAKRPDDKKVLTVTEKVDEMRARTTFTTTGTQVKRGQSPNATVLTIVFRGASPDIVSQVTNEFVTRVLQQNVQLRTEAAGQTLEFFQQEVERLGAELDTQSARMLEFQNKAGIAVPTNLGFLQGQQTSLENLITSRQQQMQSLQDQKQRMIDLFNATGGVQTTGTQLTPQQQQLQQAEQQLASAKLIYSAQNPKLLMLENQVRQLQQQVATQVAAAAGAATTGTQPVTQQQALLNSQVASLDSQIAGLQQEIDNAQVKIKDIEAKVAMVAENGATLTKLQRDISNVQSQYDTAVNRLSAAATGERIELLAKGQRISVIEQATPPESPTTPNRPLIVAAGAGAGIVAGLALVMLLELLNRSIRRPIELTNRLGITPLAVLPYLRTEREILMRRMTVLGIVAFLVVVIPATLYAVHTFVTPLDVLMEPALNKVGLSITG